MNEIYKKAYEKLLSGQDIAFVTVIKSAGSTPRGKGASMLVCSNGEVFNTIGGGLVEHLAQQRALEIINQKQSAIEKYSMAPKQAADEGMICGGAVTVIFKYFSCSLEKDVLLFKRINESIGLNEKVWLVFDFSDLTKNTSAPIDTKSASGEIKADLRLSDGTFLSGETSVCENADFASKPYLYDGFFVLPISVGDRVFIFGGGHVSQQTVPILSNIGFCVTVVENREDFAKKELFPSASDIILTDFEDVKNALEITHDDYVIVVTRGHQSDRAVLRQVLPLRPAYVGVIGSKGKVKLTKEALLKEGVEEALIDSMYAPIGLPIKSETPAEIAVSIAAQLILHRAQRQ